MKILRTSLLFLIMLAPLFFGAGTEPANEMIYGVTITSVLRLPETLDALSNLPRKPTTRIVFDEWVEPERYNDAIFQINKVSFIMGELLDSYHFEEYSTSEYQKRVHAYLNYYPDKVDIWEIGNEINGEWLGETKGVIEKVNSAYDIVKEHNSKAAITFYYNMDCSSDENNEMFKWIQKNIRGKMRSGLDYVFVSYYDEDCDGRTPDWDAVFKVLHALFPNAKLGIGECGAHQKSNTEKFIKQYYSMSISNPNFVGGYFWWYFKRDCVPRTKPAWDVMKNAINSAGK